MARFNLRFVSKSLLRKVEVNLVIPSLDLHGAIAEKNPRHYRDSDKKYPLIILLSGFGDDNEAWLLQTNISALCAEYGVAVALIGGENKWYLDQSPIDGWHTFIEDELPDFLYGNFSVSRSEQASRHRRSFYGRLRRAVQRAEISRKIFGDYGAVACDKARRDSG